MPDALVAIDERVPLNQRGAQRRSFLSQGGIQVGATEGGRGLGDRGLKCAGITDASRAACRLEEALEQLDNLPQREIPHQAKRRDNSSFFCSPRLRAASTSSSRVPSRSATAALARSSGARPRRSASWRKRSAWAGDRPRVSFMCVLYLVCSVHETVAGSFRESDQ